MNEKTRKIVLSDSLVIGLSDVVTDIKMRSSLAILRLQAAVYFTKALKDIESKRKEGDKQPEEHKYFSISAITETVAFIESTVNDFLCDVRDGASLYSKRITDEQKGVLNELLAVESKFSIIEKCNEVLKALDLETLDKGSSVVQNLQMLIRIRNEFTHYKPAWQSMGDIDKKIRALDKKIRGNPYIAKEMNFLPYRCMSFEFVHWGLTASINFVDKFSEKLELRNRYGEYLLQFDEGLAKIPTDEMINR